VLKWTISRNLSSSLHRLRGKVAVKRVRGVSNWVGLSLRGKKLSLKARINREARIRCRTQNGFPIEEDFPRSKRGNEDYGNGGWRPSSKNKPSWESDDLLVVKGARHGPAQKKREGQRGSREKQHRRAKSGCDGGAS